MRRRYEHILLNGVHFELDTKVTFNPEDGIVVGRYGDITDAYNSPSERKRHIYNGWWHWFRQHNGECGVQSKNCNFFTIQGFVEDSETGELYMCYITPAHNYCNKIVGA